MSFLEAGAATPTQLEYSCGRSWRTALGSTDAVMVLQFTNDPTFVASASLTLVADPLAVGPQALIATTADVPYPDVSTHVPAPSNAHSCLTSDLGTMTSDGAILVTAVNGSFASGSFVIPQFCLNGVPTASWVLGTFALP